MKEIRSDLANGHGRRGEGGQGPGSHGNRHKQHKNGQGNITNNPFPPLGNEKVIIKDISDLPQLLKSMPEEEERFTVNKEVSTESAESSKDVNRSNLKDA